MFHFAEKKIGELEDEVESLQTEQRRLLSERTAMENQMTEAKSIETSLTLPSNKIQVHTNSRSHQITNFV